MKLRLPLLLRLALLSTAAAYTLGSGCLFADDAPADAAQDDPIAEAVDEEEGDSPAIGFEGYTESQLVDIQSSDSAGSVIRQMLENSTTGAVANVGTSSSTSNGSTTTAAESPALTLSAPAEPVTDTTLTTSTLSDSAGEGAVAPFFSAEEAAALVVASPATSTPSLKNASTATLTSSDSPDETTSSSSATGASSSIASVGSASAGGAGASFGGASASYSLTSSAPDSPSSSLVITTPTDDTSSDPIAEDVLEDSTTEETTTSTTLPDSSASTLATTTSSATTRSLPALKLLGSTESSKGAVKVDGVDRPSGDGSDKGVQFLYGKLGDNGSTENIIYLHGGQPDHPGVVEVDANSFYICPADSSPSFNIETLKTATSDAIVKIQNNEWAVNYGSSLTLTLGALSVNGSASLEVNKTHAGAITVSIDKVVDSNETSKTPSLTSVTNSGTLTLGTNSSEGVEASSVSIGTLTNKANGTMTLNGTTTITGELSNSGSLTNSGTLTFRGDSSCYKGSGMSGTGTAVFSSGSKLYLDSLSRTYDSAYVLAGDSSGLQNLTYSYLLVANGTVQLEDGSTCILGEKSVSASANGGSINVDGKYYCVATGDEKSIADISAEGRGVILVAGKLNIDANLSSGTDLYLSGTVDCSSNVSLSRINFRNGEAPALTVSGASGALTYQNVTYKALATSESASLGRSSAGDFSLDDKACTVKNASVVLSSDKELIKAKLDGVSISTSNTVRLGYDGAEGNTLKGLAAQNIDIGYWNSPSDKGEKVHALLNGEGSISKDLQVIMTSDLTVCGKLAVSGKITIGAATNAVSYIYVNDGSANLLSLRSKNENVSGNGAASTITGGMTMKYDSSSKQAVLIGASTETGSILNNTLLELNSGKSLLMEQNITVAADSAVKNTAGTVKIGDGTEAASFVLKGEYTATGVSALQVQENATLKLNNEDTTVTTITNRESSTDAASITGGVTMKYDSDSNKAVIAGAGNGSSATITNSLLTVANGSTLSLQNVILAGNTKINAGTAAAAAVALLDEGSGESSGTATTVNLSGSVIQLSKENAIPKTGSEGVNDLTKGSTLTKTGTTGGDGNTLTIQQDPAKVYTIDYTGATGVTLTGALTFDFDTFTVAGKTGSGYYLLNELLKEYDYVALRFADDVTVDPKAVAVTSKVTMGTETVTSAGYYVANTTTTSGVVVYFDSMALPEPTTSTLGLLALAALCARRRRSRTRAHAEHA